MTEHAKGIGNASGKRARIIAVGLAAAALAFWIWYSRAGRAGSAAMTPAEIEQQAHEHPDDFRAQLRWGEILVQARRLEEAGPVLAHATQLAPNDARPYAWLGVAAV